jgi:phage shock protein A
MHGQEKLSRRVRRHLLVAADCLQRALDECRDDLQDSELETHYIRGQTALASEALAMVSARIRDWQQQAKEAANHG